MLETTEWCRGLDKMTLEASYNSDSKCQQDKVTSGNVKVRFSVHHSAPKPLWHIKSQSGLAVSVLN